MAYGRFFSDSKRTTVRSGRKPEAWKIKRMLEEKEKLRAWMNKLDYDLSRRKK